MIVYLINHKIFSTHEPDPSAEQLEEVQAEKRFILPVDHLRMDILRTIPSPIHLEICEIDSPSTLDNRRRISSMWIEGRRTRRTIGFEMDYASVMRIKRMAIHDRSIVIPKISDILLSDVVEIGIPRIEIKTVRHSSPFMVNMRFPGESMITLRPESADFLEAYARIIDGQDVVMELDGCKFVLEDRLEFTGVRRSRQEPGCTPE